MAQGLGFRAITVGLLGASEFGVLRWRRAEIGQAPSPNNLKPPNPKNSKPSHPAASFGCKTLSLQGYGFSGSRRILIPESPEPLVIKEYTLKSYWGLLI